MSAGGKAWSGSRHGSQKSESCITFCDYTGQSLQQELRMSLDKAKFFSIQTDGSTDAVNIEEELYLGRSALIQSTLRKSCTWLCFATQVVWTGKFTCGVN
eukprot:scpid89950/ scgid0724/ 